MVLEKISITSIGFTDSRKCDIFGLGKLGSAAIQGAINTAISASTNATNAAIANKTNKANIQMNEDTNAANERINTYTNDMNLMIAQEANDTNIQMMREQNDWNENMWNKQNEYNSPEAQMQRLADAGINPVMALSNGMGNASGNSSNLPQSAPFIGAEVAHMNPLQLRSGRVDPYSLIPFNLDLLTPLAQAAGIKSQMLDNKLKEIESNYRPQLYGSKIEMMDAATQHVIQQTSDLSKSQQKRLEKLGLDVDLAKNMKKQMDIVLEQRKEQFAWVRDTRPYQREQMAANLKETYERIRHMKAEEVLMKAQEKHMINQDQFNSEMLNVHNRLASVAETNADTNAKGQTATEQYQSEIIKNARYELFIDGFESAMKASGLRKDTRKRLANGLLQFDPDNFDHSLSMMMDGLVPAASEGSFNKFLMDCFNDETPNLYFEQPWNYR